MQKEFSDNLELNSLLNKNNTNKMANNLNESESFNSRSKNSSETILIEKDFRNVNSDPSMRANPSSSLLLNETSYNQTQNSNVDAEIVEPKRTKRNSRNVANNPQSNNSNFQSLAQQPRELTENIDEMEEELELKYGAAHVIKLFIPVTICLFFVIISLSLITSYQKSGGNTLIYTPFNEESQELNSTKLWMSIANASIFVSVVVVMTIFLILLYKYRCYRFIHGWLAFSSLMLLFFFTYMFIGELFKQFNIVTDMITVSILLWNFGVLGMVCIHWKGPLILQQTFLIFSCVQMALVFIKYLPEWTTWVLLAFISIWVLCPFGPLRILVETAKSRNDNLFPAMVYSSTVIYTIFNMANADENSSTGNQKSSNQAANNLISQESQEDDESGFKDDETKYLPTLKKVIIPTNNSQASTSTEMIRKRHYGAQAANNEQSRQSHTAATLEHIHSLEQQQEDEEENGVKLGLGDFIFYSILVGKASIMGDWNTVIACFLAILIGLCFTLVLLAIYHKPLPALPISLLFGLIFYFSTNLLVRPFYENLTYRQYFI